MPTTRDNQMCLGVIDALLAAGVFPGPVDHQVRGIRTDLATLANGPEWPNSDHAVEDRLKRAASTVSEIADGYDSIDQNALDAVWFAATDGAVNAQASAWLVVDPHARTEMLGPLGIRHNTHEDTLRQAALTCEYADHLRLQAVVEGREGINDSPLPGWLLSRLLELLRTGSDKLGYGTCVAIGLHPWPDTALSPAQWEILCGLLLDGTDLAAAIAAASHLAREHSPGVPATATEIR